MAEQIKLLIVDDMEWAYEVAKLKLDKKCIIDYAKTERQALKKIKENNYEIVLTDYYLGKRSQKGGLKIILAAKDKGLKTILMSKENHKKEAVEMGVNFVFKKNFPKSIKISRNL